MSGPYCDTCKRFERMPLGDREFGECTDTAKIIFDRNGNRVNGPPEVHIHHSCINHCTNEHVNDLFRKIVYQMAPSEQYDLAFKVAENVGYSLLKNET